jgi:hypothetical protein
MRTVSWQAGYRDGGCRVRLEFKELNVKSWMLYDLPQKAMYNIQLLMFPNRLYFLE